MTRSSGTSNDVWTGSLVRRPFGTATVVVTILREGRSSISSIWDTAASASSLVGRTGEYTRDSARQATLRMLGLSQPPTALFTVDNLMSSGTYEALLEHGSSMPGEISMVAFDGLDWMTYVRPPITALRQPIHEMGAEAARLLLDRIDDPDRQTRTVILPAQLIERGSMRRI